MSAILDLPFLFCIFLYKCQKVSKLENYAKNQNRVSKALNFDKKFFDVIFFIKPLNRVATKLTQQINVLKFCGKGMKFRHLCINAVY